MDIFKKLGLKPMTALKAGIAVLLGILLLAFISTLFGKPFGELAIKRNSIVPMGMGGFDGSASSFAARDTYQVSQPGIAPVPTSPVGNDAEEFEVKSYNATIETRDKETVCAKISGLKTRSDVIFENAYEYERGCHFTFKVENAQADDILVLLNSLDPKDLSENVYTIKQQVDDFTSEIDILERKKASIDETLENAIAAYDQITGLATDNNDVETLAKIIESKIRIIEQLTQERIAINEQLDRIERMKTQQLDRLQYTFFTVQVLENKYVDIENIKDSWKQAVRDFVSSVNEILQGLSIGLIALLLMLVQYMLYGLILLFVAKYGWRFIRSFWEK